MPRRDQARRAVVVLPSGLTLLNLFFGVSAIVAASNGQIDRAVQFVVFGGVADGLDGRVARATKSGSRFGEELDSLVDAISFGLAPALITYFAVLKGDKWPAVFVFLYTAMAVIRLARFNVTQAGASKSYFIGLPSPAAGGTLATFNWFTHTSLYNQTVFADLLPEENFRWVMLGLAFLMISNVKYPAMPRIGLRSARGIAALVLVLGVLYGTLFHAREFLFPFGILYVLYGLVKTAVQGFIERVPAEDAAPTDDDGETVLERLPDDLPPEPTAVPPAGSAFGPPRHRRRRRRPKGDDRPDTDRPETDR